MDIGIRNHTHSIRGFRPLGIFRLHLRRGCGTLRSDMEPLLELQRRTKAGEIAPLVDVATKHFWLWPGKAYWAYRRKEKIAIKQLELRKEKHLASDARIADIVGERCGDCVV